MVLEREGVKRGEDVTFGNFSIRDDFSDENLGMEWLTLRAPGTDRYSLTDQPGYLKLNCTEEKATGRGTPALISRRLQHHKFECSTRMIFDPDMAGDDAAGLLLLKDEMHQYFMAVSKMNDTLEVSLLKIARSGVEKLASQAIEPKGNSMELKIVSHGKTFDFYYALKKNTWELLCADVDAHYLSTANSYGFTGTTVGLYAVKKPMDLPQRQGRRFGQ